jgi:hypothetical protein
MSKGGLPRPQARHYWLVGISHLHETATPLSIGLQLECYLEILLDEFERGGNGRGTIAPWKTSSDSLGCLYVDCSSSAFIPLSHKGSCLALGKPHAPAQVSALNLGSIFALLEFASNHLVTVASFFNLHPVWMLTKSSEEVSDQTVLFKVCFISTIFRCFHASMWSWLRQQFDYGFCPEWRKESWVGTKVSSVCQTFSYSSPHEHSAADEGELYCSL